MNRLEKIVHRQSYKKVAGDFDYSVKNLLEIAFACRSVAYHNLLREVRGASSLLNEIKLDTDPITFLSIVCDELQKWDRFAAGASNLDDYTTYYEHSLESTDIELSATGIPSWPHAYYLVKNKTSKRKELIKTLNKRLRLQNWSLILTIDLDIERSLATQKALKKRRHNSG